MGCLTLHNLPYSIQLVSINYYIIIIIDYTELGTWVVVWWEDGEIMWINLIGGLGLSMWWARINPPTQTSTSHIEQNNSPNSLNTDLFITHVQTSKFHQTVNSSPLFNPEGGGGHFKVFIFWPTIKIVDCSLAPKFFLIILDRAFLLHWRLIWWGMLE